MEIKGKVHCFFEQSGTFKNEFKKIGYEAYDYDIQNNFGETDYVIDLFSEIDKAYEGAPSIFDTITKDDLIIAFYPCIYFCEMSQNAFLLAHHNYRRLNDVQKIKKTIERDKLRHEFYSRLLRFTCVCVDRNIRLIIENPWSGVGYLRNNFLKQPDVVDIDRTRRGDFFKKPTAFWYWNCNPTYGESFQKAQKKLNIRTSKSSGKAGLCSEDRSMISKDYARNFIFDFILGKTQQKDYAQLEFNFKK